MKEMEFNLGEIYIQSIMTKIATVVVEGPDDVPIYDSICTKLAKKFDVIAVENIDDFSEGSEGVISAMREINAMSHNRYNPKNYIIGVIDKDVRDFRGEVPENELVFMLNQYSIESHFASPEVLDDVTRKAIKATSDLRGENLNSYVLGKLKESIDQLYLYSLEALKGATDSSYNAQFSYSYKYGRINDPVIRVEIYKREESLLVFADSVGIQKSIEDLKIISKGKWLLSFFCETLENIYKDLPDDCSNEHIAKCQFCLNETTNKCQYKLKEGVSHLSLKGFAIENTEIAELNYVRDRLSKMLGEDVAA
jgi:hypothetical protein